ncbi:hypothetical protein M153_1520004478 [Pseudoloma neurophilia]|uniref:Uncharacterized protein n=1 Tax=Pseudoloma neurophilia TaxID=146866 RepID=A0A0R0M724_9MICR|nr:hypothetical protein M153_1520004478 [Pseudoloma neurophilia]
MGGIVHRYDQSAYEQIHKILNRLHCTISLVLLLFYLFRLLYLKVFKEQKIKKYAFLQFIFKF